MTIRLIKLYSEGNYFKEINFTNGINLICGDKSKSEDGSISTDKQNGVGKTLSIELINFCLLKKITETQVQNIPDEFLPKDSYVCLHFKVANNHYIICRNKEDKIKIKQNDDEFEEFEWWDAKSWLTNVLGLSREEVTARQYINFMIKEEDYSYKRFIELYKSNYSELLKIHFYFFNISVDLLDKIKKVFDKYDFAQRVIREINGELQKKDLDIEKLRAAQNELKSQIELLEENLDYQKAVKNIEEKNLEINKREQELNNLLLDKKQLELELIDIKDFSSVFSEEFYIDDNDLSSIFNKYKKGLGDLIKKDFGSLKEFRNQVMNFKNELLNEKKKKIESALSDLSEKINKIQNKIEVDYKDILDTKSNNLVKNFKIYRDKYSSFKEHNSKIIEYEKNEQIKDDAKSEFTKIINEIQEIKREIKDIENSFRNTFTDIHSNIMGDSNCDFKIEVKNTFYKTKYLKFNVYVRGEGSKGINQIRSVIYDLALLVNEYTGKKNLKCIIHDNLIFGSVDKDSSISVINFLSSLDKDSFQYIATVNKDDFDYEELKKKFTFDLEKSDIVRVEFTKEKPLFYKWI